MSVILRTGKRISACQNYNVILKSRFCSTQNSDGSSASKVEGKGFLDAYKKQETIINEESAPKTSQKSETFASLLRNSTFIDMGDPKKKIVIGEIFLVVDDDLYIDFGWKFHTICLRPQKNAEKYVVGAKVLLRVEDLELCTKFLGDKFYTTLLEADCTLLGLYNQLRKVRKEESAAVK